MRHSLPKCTACLPASILSYALLAVVLLVANAPAHDAQADTLRTGGTGSATMMLRRLGDAFTARAPDLAIEVVPALGSTGAISAVADGALDFAVSARPLKPEEAANSLTEMVFARTVFGLVSSYPEPGNIASSDIAGFFTNPASSWPDGTRLRVILRPKAEADSTILANAYPNMAGAIEQLRLRSEIPVAATDQDNVRTAEKIPGSLVVTTLTQMQMEKPNLRFLTIDGVAPTLANFERGTYPYSKDFYFVLPARGSAAVERFVAFLRSPEGAKTLRETGNLRALP